MGCLAQTARGDNLRPPRDSVYVVQVVRHGRDDRLVTTDKEEAWRVYLAAHGRCLSARLLKGGRLLGAHGSAVSEALKAL